MLDNCENPEAINTVIATLQTMQLLLQQAYVISDKKNS